ncbi:MAG: glycosyltransferase family 9 protein, partial [Candidatus Omnitrophota bacterium]
MINKILFITLTNIGDVILTLPTLDFLRDKFPQAKFTVIVGPRPKEIFENSPKIEKVIVYDKHARLRDKIKLFKELYRAKFDLVVDLRNSFFGVFLSAKYRSSFIPAGAGLPLHMQYRHFFRLPQQIRGKDGLSKIKEKAIFCSAEDEDYISQSLASGKIKEEDRLVVIAPGARSHIKRWPQARYVELIASLLKIEAKSIVLVGDREDVSVNKYIAGYFKSGVADLTGKTTLKQLACLLKKASLLITNDSALLHLASYLDLPVLSIFGPTDELKYGPWSNIYSVVKKDIFCRPCEKAQCRFGTMACMQLVKTEEVLREAQRLLSNKRANMIPAIDALFKRILIVRTDRIGDVILSTPVIKAMRDKFPGAYIAMMVSPYTKEIVEANPYLDDVVLYDKESKHKKWRRSIKFSQRLKKKKFDLALILHPNKRVHLITFFAGIPKRVGYNKDFGFLLTDKLPHLKQRGEKHELEYNLDLVRYLGIEPKDRDVFMPITPNSEIWVEELFRKEGVSDNDKLIAIHPCASCPSRIWPSDRFAKVAENLIEKYGFKVFVVAA